MFIYFLIVFFFFKQKTAYEMRISDWSSDVCSSDLVRGKRKNPMATHATASAPALPVSIEDIRAAHMRIADAIVRTPTLVSKTLSEMTRSEESRVGKECVSKCSSRWSLYT